MTRPLILITDDEPDIRELLDITLTRMGMDTRTAANLAEARQLLSDETFNLCLVDMRLPDGNGIDLVKHINTLFPQLPVAMITAHGNMETAIEALKAGAFDFVSKPVDLSVLRRLVTTALALPANDTAHGASDDEPQLLGKSEAMQATRNMVEKLARSQAPVYISGESGTGKELAARLIHAHSPRANNKFVAVNCGAIPNELMEAELFGHIKGAFTGAIKDKKGLFQIAEGGSLFLDEVADLPLSMQVKLLRAIQEKAVRPVGGSTEEAIDVRIISATHKDLGKLVASGDFRQDLFYRLNVIELPMPPLREHREDIPMLIDRVLTRIIRETGQPKPHIDRKVLEALRSYPFPGNVRELENMFERAAALCEDDIIQLHDLGIPIEEPHPPCGESTEIRDEGLEAYLERLEKAAIVQALEETGWNKTAAARSLGISFRALRYRLQKLGLEQDDE